MIFGSHVRSYQKSTKFLFEGMIFGHVLNHCPPELREVLLLRQQLAKSSVKKYIAMKNAVCADGRARGMFMFYGANRTGRFSGRLIQLQNLPQNKMPDLGVARELVRSGDYEQVKLLYDDVPDTLSQLIRTAFIPAPGYRFIVSDFAAIEARVIAWLAGEAWRQKVFLEGSDIYCASASAMFHVPVVKHGINSHLRQRGKVAELALGYGGSVGALKAMGALEMGVPEEELKPLVDAWRESNPNIVRLWWDVDKAVMEAVIDKSETETHGIRFTQPVRRRCYHLHGHRQHKKMGAVGILRAKILRKHCAGNQPGYPLLRHADAPYQPNCGACT